MSRKNAFIFTLSLIAGAIGVYFAFGRSESPVLRELRTTLPLADLEAPLVDRLETLCAAVANSPGSAETWGTLAFGCEVHDLRAAARLAYQEAERLDPVDPHWPYHLGHLERLAAPEQSLASLLRAARLAPAYPAALRHAGEGALIAGELDTAESLFTRLAELAPEVPHGPFGLARVALARDDPETALRNAEIALTRAPKSTDVHRVLAEAYRRSGRTAEADEHHAAAEIGLSMPIADPWRDTLGFEHGVTLHWRYERATIYLSMGRNDLAVEEWRKARRELPRSAEIERNLADALGRAGQIDEATALYRASIDRDRGDTQAHLGLASIVGRNDPTEAIHLLETALVIDPELHEARGTLGAILVSEGRTAEGIAALEAAATALPDRAEAAFNLGMAYRTSGRMGGALREFGRALALDGTLVRARFEYGATLAMAERYDEAAIQFATVLVDEPDRIGVHLNLVRALLRAGRSADALAAVRRAQTPFPEEPALDLQEAWILAVATDDVVRDTARAREISDALTVRYPGEPTAEMLELLAALEAEAGDYFTALTAIDEAVALTDDSELRSRRLEQRAAYEERRPWRE